MMVWMNESFDRLWSCKVESFVCVVLRLVVVTLVTILRPEFHQSIKHSNISPHIRSNFKIVKLCVHFVSVCLKVQNWTQTDAKVIFHPKIRLIYSGAMVLILLRFKDKWKIIIIIMLVGVWGTHHFKCLSLARRLKGGRLRG